MKMSKIQELRARGIQAQTGSSSWLPMIAGGIAAFAAGMLLVMAAGWLPSFNLANLTGKKPATQTAAENSAPAPKFEGERLGRASTAPLLKQCVPLAMFGIDPDMKIQSADIYQILKMGSQAVKFAKIAGIEQQGFDDGGFATMWGSVADCVYRQNGWALCDPDNRALAVEAIGTFFGQAGGAGKKGEASPGSFAQVQSTLRGGGGGPDFSPAAIRAAKDRVLAGLRNRLENGYLISSDFGFFAPTEVKDVVSSTKTIRNGCAQRR